MSKVAVVILNFKLKDQTIECVKSVQKSSLSVDRLIVVDNNSQDGIEEEIKKMSGITFIQSGDNLGYSGGNNIGIKKALEKSDIDWIFILNPDTVIKKDTIKILVGEASDYNAGIAGPKIYFTNSKKIWYAGGNFDLANVLGSHRGVDEEDKGQYDETSETDYVTGAAMLVKKEVFEKIGLLDERYFLYYEDSDFCYRAKMVGFKIIYVPEALVYHANAQTTGLGSPRQDYYITRNRMLFASKFLSIRTRFALFREALKNINMPMRRKALLDFILGRLGNGGI